MSRSSVEDQMPSSGAVQAETDRLFDLLNAYDVPPALLESGLGQFSVESKNELVGRVARTLEPPPLGRLLARLLLIVTPVNKPDLVAAYVTNLRSPHSDARRSSLYGLNKLDHPAINDFATAALRDDDDQVIVTACSILLSHAKQEPRLWKILQDLYQTHKDDE